MSIKNTHLKKHGFTSHININYIIVSEWLHHMQKMGGVYRIKLNGLLNLGIIFYSYFALKER